jgi:hypothetical protein
MSWELIMAMRFAFASIMIAALAFTAFGQTPLPAQNRIIEHITINGQPAEGVLVIRNGAVQTYACASPQPYVTADGAESGWACFETNSGMWLLHAQPAQQQATQQQSTNAYPQAPVYAPATTYPDPSYDYYPYPSYAYYPYSYYPYGYYPYGYYPYAYGPGFGFGFGFGYTSRVFVNRGVGFGRPFVGGRTGFSTSRSFVGTRSVAVRGGSGGRVGRR